MIPHERSLVERFAGKPFALLGVACDEDPAAVRRMIEKEGLTWPNWIDSGADSISTRWHVESLPAVFILDAAGVMRFTPDDFKSPEDIDRVVEKLLAELRDAGKTS